MRIPERNTRTHKNDMLQQMTLLFLSGTDKEKE